MKRLKQKRRDRASCLVHGQGVDTELLIDADTHGIPEIRSAIKLLEHEGSAVRSTIFAWPGLLQNRHWQELSEKPNISFQPVERLSSHRGEATDIAIQARVRTLSHSCFAVRIALLVSDFGYADVMRQALMLGKAVVAVCPEKKFYVIHNFEEMGLPVIKVPPDRDTRPRVRAILDENGKGQVVLAEARQAYHGQEQSLLVKDFLKQLGYVGDEGRYLIHAIAKFWFTNTLGPLTVFPQQCATEALHEIICRKVQHHRGIPGWRRPQAAMAFFLPRSSSSVKTKTLARRFGSSLARQVFQGGGPFLLNDSPKLVAQALHKMGYLDAKLNSELSEAMFVFINQTNNKHRLRKMGALPSCGDCASAVQAKLRHSFLSDQGSGQWHIAPKYQSLRDALLKIGFLQNKKANQRDVFAAARRYARAHKLPEMKTLNGHAFRIMRRLNTNPNRMDTVELAL